MTNTKLQLKTMLSAVKRHYQHVLAFALLLLVIVVVYGNDLEILANEALHNEAFSHVLLLPFFVGFLLYLKKDVVKATVALEKQKRRVGTKYVNEVMGVVLCLVAFLVYWYGSYTFYPLEYHILSLPIFVMGLTLILLNPRALLALIFPILFLLFLIPMPSTVLYTVGGGLANFNTQITYTMLRTAGLPITLSSSYGAPTIILTTASENPVNFAVDVACSGIYSLVAFATFATFLAFLAKTSILKKLSLFILGFFVFAALNIIRIMAIVTVGYAVGEEAALMLHSIAGLVLIFSGMLLILAFSDKVLKIPFMTKPQEQPPCPKCAGNSSALTSFCQDCGKFLQKSSRVISKVTFAKLLLLLLGCSFVFLSIQAPTFATAGNSIELSSGDTSQGEVNVFPEIPDYTLTFLYRDTDFEKIAQQDASFVYGYFPANLSDSIVYAVVGVSSSISKLHSWEVCFITQQTAQGQYPLVDVHDSREIQLLQNPQLMAKYLVFDSPDNYTQVTLYWYAKATFKTGLTVEQKYVRISLIILTQNSADYPQLEEKLLATGQLIATAWEPLKTQALISLGVPAQQVLLAVSIAFLAVTTTTQHFTEQRKTSNNLKLFNNFASPKDKLVLQTVLDLAKVKNHITTSDILENVQMRVGRSMGSKKVLSILSTLEKHGVIRRAVISVGNSPVLVWKV